MPVTTIAKKIIKQIIAKAKADTDIAVVWLYGSQAKGTATENSDFDLAIAFNNFELSDLDRRLRTEETAILWQQALGLSDNTLSVVDINTIPSYLAFNVVEYGEVILTKNKVRELKEIERVYSVFEDEMISVRSNDKLTTDRE